MSDNACAEKPLISVVIPVYNGREYLREALQSIQRQTWRRLEILVLDDGSSDDSWRLIEEAAERDRRIIPIRNGKNRGLIWTLNRGLEMATGDFIARMDADDISLPERFERQIAYMERERLDFCGTWIELLGPSRKRLIRYPTNDFLFRVGLLFQTPFSHPTLMMKRHVLDGGVRYREVARHAEEYDLALRLARNFRMGNLPEVQLKYRVHSSQVSKVYRKEQLETAAAIRRKALDLFDIVADDRERELHGLVRYPLPVESLERLRDFRNWLERLAAHFDGNDEAQKLVTEQWFRLCVRASGLGPRVFGEYRKFRYQDKYPRNMRQQLDLFVSTLLHLRYGGRFYGFLERFSFTSSL